MNEFVLNGLVKRRAELAGRFERTHESSRLKDAGNYVTNLPTLYQWRQRRQWYP